MVNDNIQVIMMIINNMEDNSGSDSDDNNDSHITLKLCLFINDVDCSCYISLIDMNRSL